jgi:hypothetical protein
MYLVFIHYGGSVCHHPSLQGGNPLACIPARRNTYGVYHAGPDSRGFIR